METSSARGASHDPVRTGQTPRKTSLSSSSVPPFAAFTDARVSSEEAQRNIGVERLSTLKSEPRAGSTLWVGSAEMRRAQMSRQPSALCMIGIVQ